jgi:hypothetical protein
MEDIQNIMGETDSGVRLSTIALFNSLTDEDFIAIQDAGQLKSLCQALSLDLQSINHEEDTTYSA